jgi:hypothetical protein
LSEVVSLLEFIDAILYLKLSVRLVNFRDEERRDEGFLDELNLRGDVWEKVGSLQI